MCIEYARKSHASYAKLLGQAGHGYTFYHYPIF